MIVHLTAFGFDVSSILLSISPCMYDVVKNVLCEINHEQEGRCGHFFEGTRHPKLYNNANSDSTSEAI